MMEVQAHKVAAPQVHHKMVPLMVHHKMVPLMAHHKMVPLMAHHKMVPLMDQEQQVMTVSNQKTSILCQELEVSWKWLQMNSLKSQKTSQHLT
jgi:hypothetical protein